ncbi:hypothetical protein [Paraburkholderia sediminicola]|uniref:hypothetical protein n=1 Tax=Paraburkholderia sediminicola TaxID=458836 RepID=UPI0038B9FE86
MSEKNVAIRRSYRMLVRGLDYAPDTLTAVAYESSGNDSPAFIAAIMLECERTVAFRNTNQRNALLPLNVNRPAVNVGASVADFHRASRITSLAHWPVFSRIVQKKPARGGPRLMHPQRRQRGPN